MRSFRNAFHYRLETIRELIPHVGIVGAPKLRLAEDWNLLARRVKILSPVCRVDLRPKGYDTRVAIRVDSTDFLVFRQIFIWQQYKPVTQIDDPEVIVDCGANAGYSALFFLKHFPRARVIAVEPDPLNAQLCRHNLRLYDTRTVVVQKAIWGEAGKLTFVEETRKPGQEWGIQVAASDVNATVDSIDVPGLMAATGVERIDLLKVDIEKSEASVFQSSPSAWLHLVRNIAIELHGPACSQIFHQALSNYSFLESHSGDVTFCLGIRPTTEHSERPGEPLLATTCDSKTS